jgi:hypothetical protein
MFCASGSGLLAQKRVCARGANSKRSQAAHMTEIESWKEQPEGYVEFTVKPPAQK